MTEPELDAPIASNRMAVVGTLRFLASHPLTRHRRMAALGRFARWQIASRLNPAGLTVPFVGDARLLVRRGMTGASGNIYAGLHEFSEMGFTLHMLRPDDLFADVGANVGSYTVLAGKVVGSTCLAVEPGDAAFAALVDNVRLNGIEERVRLEHCAVGRVPGSVRLTTDLDTGNHIVPSDDGDAPQTAIVKMTTLDELLGEHTPGLIKIDVEGFEGEVLGGATRLLGRRQLLAAIVETNRCAAERGFAEDAAHETMMSHDFTPFTYDPLRRVLEPIGGYVRDGNTLYVRDPDTVRRRVEQAPRFRVVGETL